MHVSFAISVVSVLCAALISELYARRTGVLKDDVEYYTNTWLVQFSSNNRIIIQIIANVENFEILKEAENFPGLYLFRHNKHPRKAKYKNEAISERLYLYDCIVWLQQVTLTKSTTKSYLCPIGRTKTEPNGNNPVNDRYFDYMWYMHDCRLEGSEPVVDLNVVRVWEEMNIYGNGITVMINDDGVEINHRELKDNYISVLGEDLVDHTQNPSPRPRFDRPFNHGTKCAGIITAKGDNEFCALGIAPLSKFGAVRLIGSVAPSDEMEGRALAFKASVIDISNNSWGPYDDGKTMSYLKHYQRLAFKFGIIKGRKGKGVLYVFAAGNGKENGDMCGYDSMVNNIYTIIVASASRAGTTTNYSERCSAVFVTTYSGDKEEQFNVVTTDIYGKCTTNFSGTSASAPMISGILALILEANPELTWRDVQHVLAWTSNPYPLRKNAGWVQNKAGFWLSHDFGFGLANAAEAVKFAQTFTSVPEMSTCVIPVDFRTNAIHVIVRTNACKSLPAEISYIEHVELIANIIYPRRGDLKIDLTSPQGTISHLLEPRIHDAYTFGLLDWSMDTIQNWGECPRGRWIISVYNKIGSSNVIGEIQDFVLVIHGTKAKPQHYDVPRAYYDFDTNEKNKST